jgi:hypothetical protein
VTTPAVVKAATAVYATALCQGVPFLVTVSVTNTGGAAASGLVAPSFASAGGGTAAPADGPLPAMPFSLPGGSWQEFTWTFEGTAAGPAILTVTVTGTDVNSGAGISSGPAAAPSAVTFSAAPVLSSAIVVPATVSVDQVFEVSLTVTNTGGLASNAVTPSIALSPDTGLVSVLSPPAVVPVMNPGNSHTFVWTMYAVSEGTAAFSLSATGSGCVGQVTGWKVRSCTVQTAAALAASVSAFPGQVSEGQNFLVTVTVTNTGQAAASSFGVKPPLKSGTGMAAIVAGPAPAVPSALPGNSSITLTWTMAGTLAGTVRLTSTASGADANALSPLSTGPVTSGPVVIQVPAGLAVSPATVTPSPVCPGSTVQVVLTVTNDGGATALDVTGLPSLAVSGGGTASLVSSPAVVPTLAPGVNTRLTWVYQAASPGTIRFSATITGRDGNSNAFLSVGPVLSNALTVQDTASLAALLSAPAQVSVGQTFTVTLSVTNAGGGDAASVAPSIRAGGTASMLQVGGPSPSSLPLMASMTDAVFSWTYMCTGAGTAFFSATVTGLGCGGAPISAQSAAGLSAQTPASISLSSSLSATTVAMGYTVMLVAQVSNSGQAPALVSPSLPVPLDLSIAGVTAGPSVLATVPGGGSITWTWTVAGLAKGITGFTLTLTGTDANTGSPVSAYGVPPYDLWVGYGGLLITSLAVSPGAAEPGGIVTVTMTISNTGWTTLTGVEPTLAVSGGAGLELVSAPAPVKGALLAQGDVTVVWKYRAISGGTAVFTGGVKSAQGATALPVSSAVFEVREGSTDVAENKVYPNPYDPDKALGGALKFRNMPPRTVVTIYNIAGEKVRILESSGYGSADWNGTNGQGARVAPGLYLYILKSPDGKSTRGKVWVVK